MYPVIFKIPFLNIPIYGYGLMMVAAFLATQWLSTRLAKSKGIDPEIFVNATLFALIAGVVGSRLSSVLENLSEYTKPDLSIWQNLFNMINIRSGGLTFYGGLILACPVVIGYFMYKKVPIKLAIDICAPCVMVGLGIGRIGCFLSGCCYGATAEVPWAIRFPYGSDAYVEQFYNQVSDNTAEKLNHRVPAELIARTEHGIRLLSPAEVAKDPSLVAMARGEKSNPVHPTQFYSTFNSLLIMGILLIYFTLPHEPGRVFALMLMLEGPTRYMLEMLRVEPPILGPMSLSMVMGIVLFVAGAILWLALGWNQRSLVGSMMTRPA
jgi:phosphatidylglycerol:prolipoprotein diacylglycerol transferase